MELLKVVSHFYNYKNKSFRRCVAATVYVATSEGTADSDDYEAITKQAVDFKKDELKKL